MWPIKENNLQPCRYNSAGDRALSLFKARTAGTTGVSNTDCDPGPVPPSNSVRVVYDRCHETNTSMHGFILGLLEDFEFRKVLQESNVPEQILKAKLQSLFNSALCRYGIDVLTEAGMVNHFPLRDQVIRNDYKKGSHTLIVSYEACSFKYECIVRGFRIDLSGAATTLYEKFAKDKKHYIVIDDFSTISGSMLSTVLQELQLIIPRWDVACIGVATKGVYAKFLEKHIGGYFQTLEVPELEDISTLTILRKYLPGKAITLIDAACGKVESRLVEIGKELYDLREELKPLAQNYKETEEMKETLRMMWRERAKLMEEISEHGDDVPVYKLYDLDKVLVTIDKSEVTVGPDEVADVVSQWSGLPLSILAGNEKEKLNGLAERLQARVIGQDQAVDEVAGQSEDQGGIGESIGGFRVQHTAQLDVIVGPELLTTNKPFKKKKELFGDERLITRINMSEYKNSASVTKLIGAAPGYVGYDEGGRLTNAVKKRPHGVILFDEAEKADQGIFDIFSQVLSDGRLTDSLGCTVDFTSTIIIFTSNIRAECLFESLSREKAESKVLQQVKRYFTSGFLSRLDGKVVFHPPNKAHIRQIVDLLAQDAVRRVSELGIMTNKPWI
nr:hypothetical protein [Tanacetum cinerariifolium]